MSCDCHKQAEDGASAPVLRILLVINAVMFVAELAVGLLADSAGVLADSLDMLADALVYGSALYAMGKAERIKIFAARASGVFQVLLAASIFADAVRRAVFGSEPQSLLMLAVSVVALAANAYCFILLSRQRNREVHIEASWIFTRSDVVANTGVILAAVLVQVTQSRWPDLAVGAAISLFVLYSGFLILAKSAKEKSLRG
jgi:cation diffusion facilitator family transporter